MEEIQARRSQLKKECRSCCCAFFSKGKAAELQFLDDVLEHYNRVASKDIKASIQYILDTTEAEAKFQSFGHETKSLVSKIITGIESKKVTNETKKTDRLPLLPKNIGYY